MGFGWMLLGWLFMFPSIGNVDIMPDFIGFLIMLKGLSCACRYCRCFDLTRRLAMFGVLFSLVSWAYQMFCWLDIISASAVGTVMRVAYAVFLCAYAINLAISISKIATETELPKIRVRGAAAVPLAIIMLLCGRLAWSGAVSVISSAEKDATISETLKWAMRIGYIAEVLFVVYMLLLLLSCYRWICLEGEEDMPDKAHKLPTPFDIIEKKKNKDKEEKK